MDRIQKTRLKSIIKEKQRSKDGRREKEKERLRQVDDACEGHIDQPDWNRSALKKQQRGK